MMAGITYFAFVLYSLVAGTGATGSPAESQLALEATIEHNDTDLSGGLRLQLVLRNVSSTAVVVPRDFTRYVILGARNDWGLHLPSLLNFLCPPPPPIIAERRPEHCRVLLPGETLSAMFTADFEQLTIRKPGRYRVSVAYLADADHRAGGCQELIDPPAVELAPLELCWRQ